MLNRNRLLDLATLILIALIAGVLRLGWPGVSSFAWDEARISLDAGRMARDGEFVMVGQASSVGVPFFPASVWAFVPPFLVTPDPMAARVYVGLITTATAIGVWALARAATRARLAALAAGLVIAAHPYAVLYGRHVWQPDLLAPLGLLWLAGAWWSSGSPHPSSPSPFPKAGNREGEILLVGVPKASPQVVPKMSSEEKPAPRAFFLPLSTARFWQWREGGGVRDLSALGVALACFIGGIAVQIHFAGAALALATVIAGVRWRWWRHWRAAIAGGGLALVCTIPYLYYLTVIDPSIVANLGAAAGGTAAIDLTAAENLARMAIAHGWDYLGMGEFDTVSRDPLMVGTAAALMVVGVVGLIAAVIPHPPTPSPFAKSRHYGEGEKESAADASGAGSGSPSLYSLLLGMERGSGGEAALAQAAAILLLASPLLFLRHTSPVLMHYTLIALPAIALLAAFALRLVKLRAWRVAVAAVAIVFAGRAGMLLVATLDEATIRRPPNSMLSSILSEPRDAFAALDFTLPVLAYSHGDTPSLHGEAAVFASLLRERQHRLINGDALLILPPYPVTQFATLGAFQMWEELDAAGLLSDPQEHPRREGAPPFISAITDGAREPDGFTRIEPPIAWVDGTRLIGWKARRVGDRLRVSTWWAYPEVVAISGTVQQFHHLRLEATPDVAPLVSDVPIALTRWRVGDRAIVMADFFDIAPGDYTLDIGHYTLEAVARIPLLSGGDELRIDGVRAS